MFLPVKWPSFLCATVFFGRKEAMSERAISPPYIATGEEKNMSFFPPSFSFLFPPYPHPLQLMWAIVVGWATCFLENIRDEGRIVRRRRNEKIVFFRPARKKGGD